MEDTANYAFYATVDAHGIIRSTVTIKNVSVGGVEILDETYHIANFNGTSKESYCLAEKYTEATNKCSILYQPICDATDGNSCFARSLNNDDEIVWTLGGNATSMAPGFYFFEGNVVVLDSGISASVVATLDIETGGQMNLKAINYSTYAEVCENTIVPGVYPINYCSSDTSELIPDIKGNVVIGAGGTNPASRTDVDLDGVYSGGNVKLLGSTTLYGTVLAGNRLSSYAGVTIYGYVIALDLKAEDSLDEEDNITNGSLTIILDLCREHDENDAACNGNSAPDDYDPTLLPSDNNLCAEDPEKNKDACENLKDIEVIKGGGEGSILWTRYL